MLATDIYNNLNKHKLKHSMLLALPCSTKYTRSLVNILRPRSTKATNSSYCATEPDWAESDWRNSTTVGGSPAGRGLVSFRSVETTHDTSKKLELLRIITKVRYLEHRGSRTSRLYCTAVGVTSNVIT